MKAKHFLLTISVLILLFFPSTKTVAQTLVLHHANGTTTDIELYTRPIVTFQESKVLVVSPVLNMEFQESEILRFTYEGSSLGINMPNSEADYSHEAGRIVFHHIPQNSRIGIYTTNGIRIPAHITKSGTNAYISLEAIPKGVYLLSVNGKSYKFTKL